VAEARPGTRTGRRIPWAVAGVLAAALVAGCAAVPASGVVQPAAIPPGHGSGGGGGQGCCGLLMVGPQAGWDPQQIVSNFLLASGNFANNHGVAREYLTSAASKAWHPGSAVTVIKQPPVVTLTRRPFGSPSATVVEIQAQEVATLSDSGQYSPTTGGQQGLTWQFGLQVVNHQWRIASLPSGGSGQLSSELLLTKDLFQLAYEPRNLYYLDSANQVLVPDPVFVPVESSDPGTGLVQALLSSPAGWLEGAATSAFPPAARLLRPVQISPASKIATVDLSLPAAATTPVRLRAMMAELVWTLTSPSYSPAPAQAVQLEVNGRTSTPDGTSLPVQDRNDYPQRALDPPGHQNLYFLAANGAGREIRGAAGTSTALPGQAGTGQVPLHILAISPDQRYFAGIAGPSSTVYISDLFAAQNRARSPAGNLVSRLTGSNFTSISWDRRDELWVAGKVDGQSGVWVVSPGTAAVSQVNLPLGTGTVTALRVAPDGVRVAMIVNSAAGSRLLLGAIVRGSGQLSILQTVAVGADVSDPSALTWYDADHLLVVAQSSAGPGLDEVPVDGDHSTAMGVQPGMVSITAAGPLNALYASLQTNPAHLARSIGVGELWNLFVPGSSASYPD
jgi:lipoprotein LpqB-like beta-propeller protein/sporulation and spore germination protein